MVHQAECFCKIFDYALIIRLRAKHRRYTMFRPIFFTATVAVFSCITFVVASPELMNKLV